MGVQMYAIVDIETTGGSARAERITEIAIYQHNGEKITGEFVTLINPERNIPYFITNLTGISNELVEDAPKFYEVARRIIEMTEGRTFVAHNARFDYSFIRQEFKALGYNYSRSLIDTVAMSRKLFPGYRSYSLGNICKELGIGINGRHRAAGDALATAKLFGLLLEKDMEINGAGTPLVKNRKALRLNPLLDPEKVRNIPEEPGIYYFYDERHKLIYIGKSCSLKQRIDAHLSNNTSGRAMEMREKVADIDWDLTGSELIALLRESAEIKENKPAFNRAQRRSNFQWGIFSFTDEKGYLNFRTGTVSNDESPISLFTGREKARAKLEDLVERYNLCQRLAGLYDSSGSCFRHHVGLCAGACCGQEAAADYNKRAGKAAEEFLFSKRNFFIIDRGREPDQKCAVKIINGRYAGFGYFNINDLGFGLDALHDCIKPAADNRDIQVILKQYLRTNKVEKIIEF